MPKDNENVPLPDWATELEETAPARFAPNEMVRCDNCLRANPPTRVNCLYCGVLLPSSESSAVLQQPLLRPLEKWERGYNNILMPPAANLTTTVLAEAAGLLRLTPEHLALIFAAGTPLPLARASSLPEASLIKDRLQKLGINSLIMPDAEVEPDTGGVFRVRSMEIDQDKFHVYQSREASPVTLSWSNLRLIVSGRLVFKRVEFKEQKAKRAENSILEANEFITDETVVDFYAERQSAAFRIAANSFNFSCLGANKSLLVADNIMRLVQLIRENAPQAEHDNSFNSLRKVLELVWPAEQQNESSGWRRERPGKVSLGSATELNNQSQFQWYSQMRRFLQTESALSPEQQPCNSESHDGLS